MNVMFRNILRTRKIVYPLCHNNTNIVRHLYSYKVLGLYEFQEEQDHVRKLMHPIRDKFVSRLSTAAESETIFTEDLRNLGFIASAETEYKLLFSAIERYQQHKAREPFPSKFELGQFVLRMFADRGETLLAYKWFMDENQNVNEHCRSDITCYVLMLDMLYKEAMFDEIVSLYANFEDQFHERRHFVAVLVLGALYKINSQDALSRCLNILEDLSDNDSYMMMRGLLFSCMLAYRQESPEQMLEILMKPTFSHIRASKLHFQKSDNMNMLAYIKLGRLEEALNMLQQILARWKKKTPIVFPDVIDSLTAALSQSDSVELKSECDAVIKALQRSGLIYHTYLDASLDRFVGVKEMELHNTRYNRHKQRAGFEMNSG